MAKKQTRRSISVSRTTYERLKAFCESNNISMSQLVETRVNDFLGEGGERPSIPAPRPAPASIGGAPRPAPIPSPVAPVKTAPPVASIAAPAEPRPAPAPIPMTSAAARFAVEPPPPIIKQKQDTNAPKPAEKRPDQIFTF
jgi:hypothetical protein